MTGQGTRRFEGRVVLVAGAGCVGPGWGNGRAIAVQFAAEGAAVFAVDRNPASMEETVSRIEQAGGTVQTHEADVTSSRSVADMAAACLARFARIDVLVNAVGGSAAGGPAEMTEEVWDAQIDHNLKSVFLTCKHVLPVMQAQGSGAVVNIASTSGIRWTGSAQVAYAATKAAVIQLSRVVAMQYAPHGVRVGRGLCDRKQIDREAHEEHQDRAIQTTALRMYAEKYRPASLIASSSSRFQLMGLAELDGLPQSLKPEQVQRPRHHRRLIV